MVKNFKEKKSFVNELKKDWLAVLLIIASFIGGIVAYPYLPDMVPSHWNIYGQVDNYSSKHWGAFGIPILSASIYLLMVIIPRIDPRKENYPRFQKAYKLLKLSFVLFLFFLHAVVLLNAVGYQVSVERFVSVAVGLLIVVIGNVMGQFKHNYFVGIKVPWTLANEDVWKKTHRLAGKIWVVAGLAIVVAGMFFNGVTAFIVLIISLAIATLIPAIYAYKLHKEL